MMSGIAMVGLLYQPKPRRFRTVGGANIFLLSIDLLDAYVPYLNRE